MLKILRPRQAHSNRIQNRRTTLRIDYLPTLKVTRMSNKNQALTFKAVMMTFLVKQMAKSELFNTVQTSKSISMRARDHQKILNN